MVEYADWQAGLEVGISIIDDQHRRLFELAATFQGDGDQIRVMKTLALLMDYIKTHLRDEEELMEAWCLPRLAEHRQMHAEFRQMLLSLLERAKRLSLDEIAGGCQFLINGWFFKASSWSQIRTMRLCSGLPGFPRTSESNGRGEFAAGAPSMMRRTTPQTDFVWLPVSTKT